MKFPVLVSLLFSFFSASAFAQAPAPVSPKSTRAVQSLDAEWLFSRGDAPAAEQPMFDDANWRTVDVPHDWAIEGPFLKDEPVGRGGGYRPSGVSWYRKRFTLPPVPAGRRVFVEFDGVMANSEVWINGHRLGRRPFGYVSFGYELTGLLERGDDRPNTLAVRTDTTAQPDSRWYTGQGIYRHVRLVTTDAVRIAPSGLFVSTPQVSAERAVVRLSASVVNGSDQARDLSVHLAVLDPAGHEVGSANAPVRRVGIGETADFSTEVTVAQPQRWDLGAGRLYRAAVQVRSAATVLDEDATAFGIRDARFEPATGFWLNGKNLKLKGVALHHDGGAVGAAVPLRIWERRLENLRAIGVNAIRTAHNPPAPEFLDLCDRLGFLVMDELFDAWTVGKPNAEQGYNLHFPEWGHADARDTIRRDRNHPSIILYSAGNEIHDTPNAALAKNILAGLVGVIRAEDPTRSITQALFRPNVSHDYTNGLADMLDVIGTNYRDRELLEAHRLKPTRKIVGTEQDHLRETWLNARDHAEHSGQFLWAGIDYLGEADWPSVTSGAGLLDRTGALKPRAYERQSWWSDTPMVRIARSEAALAGSDPRRRPGFDRTSDWTPRNPASYKEAAIEVYSNCDEVELLLNDQSLGSKTKPADAAPRAWRVPYAPGTLRALGKNAGQVVATHELRTAGAPSKLTLSVDRARLTRDWDDVSFVTVTAVDAAGVPCPWAGDLVTFKLEGPGLLAAVDNGDRDDPAPFQATERKLFRGECVALIKTGTGVGQITVTASAPGLADATVVIEGIDRP